MPFQVLGVGRDISDGLYKLFNSKQDIVNKKRQSELSKRTEWLIQDIKNLQVLGRSGMNNEAPCKVVWDHICVFACAYPHARTHT